MQQKDVSDVIVEWSAALQSGIPHMPDAVADRITTATGDLMNGFAETVMELSYHAPIPDEVRAKLDAIVAAARETSDEIAALRTAAQTTLERLCAAEQRLDSLEERSLDAREAGGE